LGRPPSRAPAINSLTPKITTAAYEDGGPDTDPLE